MDNGAKENAMQENQDNAVMTVADVIKMNALVSRAYIEMSRIAGDGMGVSVERTEVGGYKVTGLSLPAIYDSDVVNHWVDYSFYCQRMNNQIAIALSMGVIDIGDEVGPQISQKLLVWLESNPLYKDKQESMSVGFSTGWIEVLESHAIAISSLEKEIIYNS